MIALASVVAGCGDNRFAVVPVEGQVKLNGQPLVDAFVTFDPRSKQDDRVAGPGSFGKTDSNGMFALETYDGRTGAVLAEHQVSIRTMLTERGADGRLKVVREELLPSKYHESTQLVFEVPAGGTSNADFDLETK